MCAQAALLLLAGATLQAQSIVPIDDFPPPHPGQHSVIIGLVASPFAVGQDINLVTTSEIYGSPFYSGSRLTFQKYADVGGWGLAMDEQSLAVSDTNKMLFTGVPAFQFSVITYDQDTATPVPIDESAALPTGFALDSSGAMYLYTTTGVAKYLNASTGTRSLTMGASGSGAGQLSIPGGALAVGPGGILYAFDPGNNRVVRFDTLTGTYLGDIPLVGANATTALLVSPSGRLYTANGSGGGTVYDALSGALLETFSSSVANPDLPGLGNAVLFLDGRGFLYLYDVATGMHVFSDPASVAAGADLGVTISGPGSITAGTNISYDVKITKNGATDAINATLSDVLPANTTFVSVAQTSGPAFTCTKPAVGATGSVNCTIATLPALTSATFTVVLKVDANIAAGLLTNTASSSSAAPDPIPGNDSASATALVNVKTDLAVTKSGPTAVTSGNDVTYTFTVTNNGPNDAQNVVVSDPLALGTTFVSEEQTSGPAFSCTNPTAGAGGSVSCTIPTLAVGASAAFTFVVHLGAHFSGATLTNRVNVSSSTTDPTPANDSAATDATVDPGAQTIIAVSDFNPAPGHGSVIGLIEGLQGISNPVGPLVCLGTTLDVHCASAYAGSDLSFINVLDVDAHVLLIHETSLVALHPQDPKKLLFTEFSFFGANVTTYAVATPPVVTSVVIDGAEPSNATLPTGLALDPSGAMYAFTFTGVGKYADSTTGVRSLTMGGSGSGAGTLSIPGGALAVGADGVLYALDPGNNRVARFDTSTGSYLGSISLTGPTATTALAISTNGRLYTANGLAGGTVYDVVSGALLDTFNALAVNPEPPFPGNGITSLLLDGRGYVYLYDAATGMHVFSDPASASTDLAVSNSGPASIIAGTNVTYNITASNNGPNDVQRVTFDAPLPVGTTFVSVGQDSGPAFTCTNPVVGGTGAVSCMIATLASGASATFTLVFRLDASASSGSTITSIATISYGGGDPMPGNNSAPTSAAVGTSADLVVTKTGPATIMAGNHISYAVTVVNSGPGDAQSVTLSDTLPAGTTFVSLAQDSGPAFTCTNPAVGATGVVSCTIATLASGASAAFTVVLGADANVANGSTITNTATVASSTSDADLSSNSAAASAIVGASVDLVITKNGPATIMAGDLITYAVTVVNSGPSDAQSVALSDTLPTGTTFVSEAQGSGPAFTCATPAVGTMGAVSCTIATLASGASAAFTVVLGADANAANGSTITNTATVASSTSDPDMSSNSAFASATVGASADLMVTQSGPPTIIAGNNVTYAVTVVNSGPSDAQSVALSDTLPTGTTFVSEAQGSGPAFTCATPAVGAMGAVSCTLATLASGASATFTLVFRVDASAPIGSIMTNVATISYGGGDPTPGNNSAPTSATVGTSADLVVTKSSPATIIAGNSITYIVTVVNNGPSDAQSVTLSDALPSGTTFLSQAQDSDPAFTCTSPAVGATGVVSCTIATLASGASATFTLALGVDANAANGSTITNTATVSSPTSDPDTSSNNASASATVGASADLVVTKSGPPTIIAGNSITYTITVTNNGPSNAESVTLGDTLPAGTSFVSLSSPGGWSCTTPAIGAGGTVSCLNVSLPVGDSVFTLIVAVDSGITDGTVITNTAAVSSSTSDPNTGDESDTAMTTAGTGSADVSVTNGSTLDPVMSGTNLTYTVTVSNAGPSNATTVVLSDTLPAGTTFVSLVSPSGWSCTTPAVDAAGTVSCSNATMAVGDAVFTLTVAVSSVAGSVLTNIATVTSADADPNPGNESSTVATDVISPATLSATKTASGAFSPGSTVTYTIVISNSGPAGQSDNPGHELIDVLPPELALTFTTATSGAAVAMVGTNTVTWNGAIATGASVAITIQALIEANAAVGSTISNQATIHYDADGDGTNEVPTVTDDPLPAGSGNTTGFIVAAPAHVAAIPALDGLGLAFLVAFLAGLGLLVMRRS